MGYQLGVDLGTTYTAAAISRDGHTEPCTLGSASPIIPSVVLLRADGEVLVGDVAVRRGQAEPTRVAREFKRRLGDPTPLVLGGTPYGAEALMAHVLRSVVATVTAREGEAPELVVLTHPANFGPYKLEMMREVARQAGLDLGAVEYITEPQAAAISYATRSRVEAGEIIAVYDLGGGTFDAALLQRNDDGFALIGRPDGMERFGGIDIDSAILALIDERLDGRLSDLEPDDPAVQASMLRLRDDVRLAKETLSSDTDTEIHVAVPGIQQSVRLTRSDIEGMIRPRLGETVDAVRRTASSAGIDVDRVSRVLLVGGSSQIPLIADALRTAIGRPVSIDAHPKLSIALGAAAHRPAHRAPAPLAGTFQTTTPAPTPTPAPAPTAPTPAAPAMPAPTQTMPAASEPTRRMSAPPPAPEPFRGPAPAPNSAPAGRRTGLIAAAVLAVVALAGIGAFVALRGDDSPATRGTTPSSASLAPNPTAAAATNPVVTTPAPTTPAPTNPPPTAPAPTTPLTPLVSPSEVDAAMLTRADLSAGFVDDFLTGSNTDLCGVLFEHQPVLERSTAFTRNPNQANFESIAHAVGVYDSAANAAAIMRQQIDIVNSSCTGFESLIGGQSFTGQAVAIEAAPVKQLLPAQCSDATMVLFTQRATADPTVAFTSSYLAFRCGNIISSITSQFSGTEQPPALFADATAALSTTINRISQLPLRQ